MGYILMLVSIQDDHFDALYQYTIFDMEFSPYLYLKIITHIPFCHSPFPFTRTYIKLQEHGINNCSSSFKIGERGQCVGTDHEQRD